MSFRFLLDFEWSQRWPRAVLCRDRRRTAPSTRARWHSTRVSLALVLLFVPTSDLVDLLPLPGGLGGVEMFMATLIAAPIGTGLALAAGVVLLYRLHSYWFLILVGAVASVYAAGDVLEGADPRRR